MSALRSTRVKKFSKRDCATLASVLNVVLLQEILIKIVCGQD